MFKTSIYSTNLKIQIVKVGNKSGKEEHKNQNYQKLGTCKTFVWPCIVMADGEKWNNGTRAERKNMNIKHSIHLMVWINA